MINVSNMRSSNGNSVPNQFIIHHGKSTYFQSYRTVIAKQLNGKTTLDSAFDCSVTTMKYLGYFLGHNIKETREKIASGEYKIRDLNK